MNDTITVPAVCASSDYCTATHTSTHGPGKSTVTSHAKNACKTKDFSAESHDRAGDGSPSARGRPGDDLLRGRLIASTPFPTRSPRSSASPATSILAALVARGDAGPPLTVEKLHSAFSEGIDGEGVSMNDTVKKTLGRDRVPRQERAVPSTTTFPAAQRNVLLHRDPRLPRLRSATAAHPRKQSSGREEERNDICKSQSNLPNRSPKYLPDSRRYW